MKKRATYLPYFYLFLAFFFILGASKESVEILRGGAASIFAPIWRAVYMLKHKVVPKAQESTVEEEINRLELENQLLINEIKKLRSILDQEEMIFWQKSFLSDEEKKKFLDYAEMIRRRDFIELLNVRLFSIPAAVIYRSPGSWSSSLWIDVGKKHNEVLGKEIVAVNSPVVLGNSVVGVIDSVGNRQSRVRLITDPGLNPSVRAVRREGAETLYLAKGWLEGCSDIKWRRRSNKLKGVGFNYDFSDDAGMARDLRTGEILCYGASSRQTPIAQNGDLLITTGMDGVFPPGLKAAVITDVRPLQEGDFYYDLEAEPTAGNLDDLDVIYVMPPVGFENGISCH